MEEKKLTRAAQAAEESQVTSFGHADPKENGRFYLTIQRYDEKTHSYREEKVEWDNEEGVREYLRRVWRENNCRKFEQSLCGRRANQEGHSDDPFSLDSRANLRVQSLDAIMEGGGEGHLPASPDFAQEEADEEDQNDKMMLLRKMMKDFDDREMALYRHFFCGEKLAEKVTQQTYRDRDKLIDKLRKGFTAAGYGADIKNGKPRTRKKK